LRVVARAIGVITTIKIASYLLATLLLLLLHRLLFYGLLLGLLLHGFLLHGLHLKVIFIIPQLLKHVLMYSLTTSDHHSRWDVATGAHASSALDEGNL
jgi:hypothetical protein